MSFLPWLRAWAAPFASAFVSAILLTGLLVRIAATTGWVAAERQERWKKSVAAKFGGLPIILAFSTAALFLPHSHEKSVLLLLTWLMGIVALLGDVLEFSPKIKLLGQILVAGVAVKLGVLHVLSAHYWTDAIFTVVWIVAITNAVLLLDNMDGLAAGLVIIASADIVLFADPAAAVTGLTICMIASLAGYLLFNFSPAKVFMGNVGTFAVGFFLACASVKTAAHLSSLWSVLFVPCTVLFIPFFDTVLVSITRRMNGKALSRRGRDHTSHRLVLAGLTDSQAVALLYAIAIIAGMMAFLEKSYWAAAGPGIVAFFLIGAALFWVYLAKLQVPRDWLSEAEGATNALPEFLPQLVTRIAVILLDAVVIMLGLYFAFLISVRKMDQTVFGQFLFASALSIAVKITMLIAFGSYRKGWELRRKEDIYPVLKAILVSAVFLAAVSAVLPSGKSIAVKVLILDAVLTFSLLLLVRASSAILDELFSMSRFSARNKHLSLITAKRPTLVRIIGRLNGGGPARQACFLHERLAGNFETHLLVGSLDEGEQDMSYLLHSERNVLRLPQMSRRILPWADTIAFWKLLRYLASVRPEIVHTHTAKAGTLGRLAAWLVGVPVVVHTFHGHIFHGYFEPLKTRLYIAIERLMGHLSTQLITVSESQKRELSLKYRVASADSISVINNGIELERFSQPRREDARRVLGIPADAFVAAWAGRMAPVKDVQLLAQVIVQAAEKNKKIFFLIVGDGTEKSKLQSMVCNCKNVQLLGWQQHIEQVLFAADIAILTSRNEGTPTNLIEAMAVGLPFVATDVGGVQDLAVAPLQELPDSMGFQAANGFLTARNAEAVLHCIERIVADPDLASRMGSVGRQFVWERFSVPRMVQETQSLYQTLLARSGAVSSVNLRQAEGKASHAGDTV